MRRRGRRRAMRAPSSSRRGRRIGEDRGCRQGASGRGDGAGGRARGGGVRARAAWDGVGAAWARQHARGPEAALLAALARRGMRRCATARRGARQGRRGGAAKVLLPRPRRQRARARGAGDARALRAKSRRSLFRRDGARGSRSCSATSDARGARGGGAGAVAHRDAASRTALRGCTKDAAVHVRATCAKALADVGNDEDADVLAPLVDDKRRAGGGGGGAYAGQAGGRSAPTAAAGCCARCRTRRCRGGRRWCRR